MDQIECAICLEKLSPHEPIEDSKRSKDPQDTVTTPCQHTYHRVCFEKWLSVSNTCPHCRTVLYEAVPVPIVLPPFDGELQLQWIMRDIPGMPGIHSMSNMTRDYDLRHAQAHALAQERDQIQNKLMTVVSYVFCLIGSAYCLGDCSGMAGNWILG